MLSFYSTNSLSWEQLNYEDGEIFNLHYGLIHKGLPTLIDLQHDVLPCINEGCTPKKSTQCINGDVAFADASEDTNDVGKAIEFVDIANKQVVCGLHTIHGRDTQNATAIGFKGYAFASKAFHNQISRIAQGTKVFSISQKNFDEVTIGLPSKEEQIKIAQFLRLIDDRIATQNKIIEDLKKLKSAICNVLFSNLKADTMLLGDVANIVKGKQVNGEELLEHGTYYVMNGGIEPSGYLENYNSPSKTISISEGGNSCGYVQWNDSAFWSGGHCYTLHNINSSVSGRYLYHYLKWKEPEIMALRIGSGLPNIQKKDISKVVVPVPPKMRQHEIQKTIDALEAKTDNEVKLLQCAYSLKQHLLSQMFI